MTPMKRRTPALLLTLLTVGVAALVLALTTGGGSDAAPRTRTAPAAAARAAAAVPPAAAPAAVPKAAPRGAAHRGDSAGQMYLTDTDERRGQLIHAWFSCLLAHGATQETGTAAAPYQGRGRPVLTVADPVPAEAKAACTDTEPLLPKEENPSLNPDYAADSAANVACIRAHGTDVHTIPDTSVFPDGLGWTYDTDHTLVPDDEAQIEQACLIQSFGS